MQKTLAGAGGAYVIGIFLIESIDYPFQIGFLWCTRLVYPWRTFALEPAQMALDKRYLEKHGNQWRVQVKVPAPVRHIVGKAKLVRPLKTDSLAKANALRWNVVAEFREVIASAQRQLETGSGSLQNPIVRDALDYRKELQRALKDPSYGQEIAPWGEVVADGPMVMRSLISERAQELSEAGNPGAGSIFYKIASGEETLLVTFINQWLAESSMKPRQKIDYRRAVLKLDRWLGLNGHALTIEAVTRKAAGDYVTKAFVERGAHWRTANKDISCLSSYWKWLRRKGHVEDNVWQGQSLPERRVSKQEKKRPYTDEEVLKLISNDPPEYLMDAIFIAALSGMRVEEIAQLRIRDVQNGVIDVKLAKTPAGEREVPIHSSLFHIFERRCKGKPLDSFLFDELPTPAEGSPVERSQKISKRFTDYRRRIGVDDRLPGARQSRVDFHSFRRWFSKKAADALDNGATGYSPWTIAEVIGHSKEDMPLGMTMGRYAGDTSLAAKQACVESVTLPIRNKSGREPE
ncbi:DUF6538 domain-containing protein [Methylocystis echinoides]|uniref:DUF6538 domain-containing protein n=1 Tax=Methylocystis echinoides TaxID=29468 RepID=UPI00341779C6